ncbi:MAG TPA: DUF4385 family protein [Kofleriaceae bacterium]|nr:DUF4385 family protein [Kofleriaceae bacterium]
MKATALEAAMLELLDARGTATACPSEVARKVGGPRWRALMPEVRAAAIRLQQRHKLDAYQRGRPVDLREARGPVRLRTHDVRIDHRAHPERYVIGRGEQGVLTVEPYKSELLPLWRFRTPDLARRSARALYRAFLAYGRQGDFIGMDMARKFLQMGVTRARRYANHKSGRKYDGRGRVRPLEQDPTKAAAAEEFRVYYERAKSHRRYRELRAAFVDG